MKTESISSDPAGSSGTVPDRELLELAAKAASEGRWRVRGGSGIKADDWIIGDEGYILCPTLSGHADPKFGESSFAPHMEILTKLVQIM